MANEVIGIDVQVKLEQLRAQLATLGPGMDKEAKAMTAALAKEVKKQTAEMQKLSASAATATGSFSQLSGTVSKTAQVSGALGGVVAKLNPEMGTAITSVGSLTGVMQGLSSAGVVSMAALGPIAVVVAALAGAYLYLSSELEKAEAAQEKMSEAATRAQKAHGDLKTVVQDVTDAYEVSVGITDAAAVSQRKSIEKVNAAFTEEAEAIKASALEAGSMTIALQSLEAKRRGTIALIEETTEVELAATEATKAKTRADKRAAEVSREAASAAKASADTAALYARDESARRQTAVDEKEEEAHKEVEAAQNAYDKKVAMYQAEAEVKDAIRQADLASAKAAAEEEKEIRDKVTNAVVSLMDSTSAIMDAFSDDNAKKNKAQALQAFAVAKTLAVSTALINTALAVTKALAEGGALGVFLAATAAVAGGVQVAAIAAEKPSFHRGGLVEERGRGEVSATLLPGESVLNRQATSSLGAGGVAALNNGGGGGGSVSLRIGRLEAREIIRTDVASGGLVVQAARSAAAKGGNLAGRSGRRPIG
jgi:hypothetical protein